MLYQTKLRMLEKMKAPICWTWCEKATSVGNSSSWLPRVWTVWTYFMLMPPHHYLTHTLHTLKKHILSSGWCSYFYALISPFCSKYPRKLLGFHTWYWPYRHLWGLWAPNHAGDWCSRWQLANQMVMRNMIRYIWFTWKRNDDDCDQDDGEGNGTSVMIWHGWSIACQPLMACCDFFLDKLSNSAPFCSHFQLLQSTFMRFLFFKMNWIGQFLYIL